MDPTAYYYMPLFKPGTTVLMEPPARNREPYVVIRHASHGVSGGHESPVPSCCTSRLPPSLTRTPEKRRFREARRAGARAEVSPRALRHGFTQLDGAWVTTAG